MTDAFEPPAPAAGARHDPGVRPPLRSTPEQLEQDHTYATVLAGIGTPGLQPREKISSELLLDLARFGNWEFIASLPRGTLEDAALARELVPALPWTFFLFADAVRADPQLALEACKRYSGNCRVVPPVLLTDPVFAEQMIKAVPAAIPVLPPAVRSLPSVARQAAGSPSGAAAVPDEALRADRELLSLCRKTLTAQVPRAAFSTLAPLLQADPQIQRAFVEKQPESYFDLSPERRQDPLLKEAFRSALSAPGAAIYRQDLPPEALADPAVARAVARGAGLAGLTPAQRRDPELIGVALESRPGDYLLLDELKATRAYALRYLEDASEKEVSAPSTPPILLDVPESLRGDPEVALKAVLADARSFEHLPARLRDDAALARLACGTDGLQLRFASGRLRADPDTVAVAVRNNNEAFQYADRTCQLHPHVLASVRMDHDRGQVTSRLGDTREALAYAVRAASPSVESMLDALQPGWTSDKDLLRRLVRTPASQSILPCISEEALADPDFASEMLGFSGEVIKKMPPAAQADPRVRRFAWSQPSAYSPDFKDGRDHLNVCPDDEAACLAVRQNPRIIWYRPDLAANRKVVAAALTARAATLGIVPKEYLDDLELLVQVARRNPMLLDYLPKARRDLVAAACPEASRQRAALAETFRALGLDHPLRFEGDLALVTEVIRNRTLTDAHDRRPRAVLVVPKSDWNGAFTTLAWSGVSQLTQRYRLSVYEAGTDLDVVRAIRDASRRRKVDLLVLGGHGNRTGMSLTESHATPERRDGRSLDVGDLSLLNLYRVRERLQPGGKVVLASCSTGRGQNVKPNVANLLARAFPQAYVYAPTRTANFALQFDRSGLFEGVDYGQGGGAYVVPPRVRGA